MERGSWDSSGCDEGNCDPNPLAIEDTSTRRTGALALTSTELCGLFIGRWQMDRLRRIGKCYWRKTGVFARKPSLEISSAFIRIFVNVFRAFDIMRMGHAIVRPTVGAVTSGERAKLKQRNGRMLFANSDLSGISIFEEAQFRGVEAAQTALRHLAGRK